MLPKFTDQIIMLSLCSKHIIFPVTLMFNSQKSARCWGLQPTHSLTS